MMKTLLISATAMVLAAPALAQVTTPSAPAAPPASAQPITPAAPPAAASVDAKVDAKVDVFAKADADKNGSLTIAEVKMADATATQADFDKYDADKSKSLSKAEFDMWATAKAGAKASAPGQ